VIRHFLIKSEKRACDNLMHLGLPRILAIGISLLTRIGKAPVYRAQREIAPGGLLALLGICTMAAQAAYCINVLDIGPHDQRDLIA
jgi:hypothetical protein